MVDSIGGFVDPGRMVQAQNVLMVQAAPATGARANAVTLETATGVTAALDVGGVVQGAVVETAQGRGGLHSSTFRLNVSTFCGIRWVEYVTKRLRLS